MLSRGSRKVRLGRPSPLPLKRLEVWGVAKTLRGRPLFSTSPSVLLQFAGLMWEITTAHDNSWMIQLAPDWFVTASLQREKKLADLDLADTCHPHALHCSIGSRYHVRGTTADLAPRIKTEPISRFHCILDGAKHRAAQVDGRSNGVRRRRKKTWFMTSGWIIHLLISVGWSRQKPPFLAAGKLRLKGTGSGTGCNSLAFWSKNAPYEAIKNGRGGKQWSTNTSLQF